MKNNISINCHSSIKITGDKVIYFDPYCIEEESHDADIIFITHDHYDHFDLPSIKNVMKKATYIVIPNTCASNVLSSGLPRESILGVNPNEEYNFNGLETRTVSSYNTNKDFHKKEANYVGYIITLNDEKIYVAGDTDINDENKKVECDIALIPIGGKYTMTYSEAAELINTIKPKHVIPTHYAKIIGELEDGNKFAELLENEIECHLLIK